MPQHTQSPEDGFLHLSVLLRGPLEEILRDRNRPTRLPHRNRVRMGRAHHDAFDDGLPTHQNFLGALQVREEAQVRGPSQNPAELSCPACHRAPATQKGVGSSPQSQKR